MRLWYVAIIGLVLICGMGCASVESASKKCEKKIPLSQVPKEAVAAAQLAVEGITFTEAEVEKEGCRTVYELEGTAKGAEYEVKVTADGKVLNTKQEADDEHKDKGHCEGKK